MIWIFSLWILFWQKWLHFFKVGYAGTIYNVVSIKIVMAEGFFFLSKRIYGVTMVFHSVINLCLIYKSHSHCFFLSVLKFTYLVCIDFLFLLRWNFNFHWTCTNELMNISQIAQVKYFSAWLKQTLFMCSF